MQSFKILNFKKPLIQIISLGALLRLLFNLFIAKYYFGTDNFYLGGDTMAWGSMFENLWNHGVYVYGNVAEAHEYGYFFRMPGYSFFLGFFWLLCGQNWEMAIPMAGWFQTIMDIFNIYLVYRISLLIFKHKGVAHFTALIYACYPFVIVWNPHTHSEIVGITFGLLAVLFFLKGDSRNYLISGIMLAIASFMRPQYLFLAPIFGLLLILLQKSDVKTLMKNATLLGLGFALIYGPWPMRNYFNYGKLIVTQDLRGAPHWDVDVINFMQYIYSVKTEWEPQMSQILGQSDVEIPKIILNHPNEAAELKVLFEKAKSCSRGFSYWKTAQRKYQKERGCTDEVAMGFKELRARHIKMFPLNYYIILPLQNLKKALLKSSLSGEKTTIKKLASSLFIIRTLLILLGIAGLILMMRNKVNLPVVLMIGVFFITIYLFLCAGTSPQMRNIEVRYFLQADIFLLFPAAWMLFHLIRKIFPKKFNWDSTLN
ncbi:MAG: glycosyltransferase family 39 protein [Flavobacteriales bacterium]